MAGIKEIWRHSLQSKSFRWQLPVTISALLATLLGLSRFLDYIEKRKGVVLPDPLLQHFNPIDATWLTFMIIYLSVIVALIYLSQDPQRLLIALQAYILLIITRIVSMYVVPLDPPLLLIPLSDPFVESLSSGTLTRDLFFSGHTSTLFLLFLTARGYRLRLFFLAGAMVVGISVLIQHVHYSIDVLAAPFYSYTCYRLSLLIRGRHGNPAAGAKRLT